MPAGLMPPRNVEYTSADPAALNFVTKAPSPIVLMKAPDVWKAPFVVGNLGDKVTPVT